MADKKSFDAVEFMRACRGDDYYCYSSKILALKQLFLFSKVIQL